MLSVYHFGIMEDPLVGIVGIALWCLALRFSRTANMRYTTPK